MWDFVLIFAITHDIPHCLSLFGDLGAIMPNTIASATAAVHGQGITPTTSPREPQVLLHHPGAITLSDDETADTKSIDDHNDVC